MLYSNLNENTKNEHNRSPLVHRITEKDRKKNKKSNKIKKTKKERKDKKQKNDN